MFRPGYSDGRHTAVITYNLLQETASLRASYKSEVTAVELNLQEVLLQFESKVSRLEKDKQNILESPSKADKINRIVQAENAALKSKLKVLTSSNEEFELQIKVLQKTLQQAESDQLSLETGLKLRVKQSEASNEALQKQITQLLNQMEEKEKIINNHENKSKSLVKDLEQINEKLNEKDREHRVELSSFEVSKAKEISSLKTELSMIKQKSSSQAISVQSLQAQLEKIGEKHSSELGMKDEDLAEAKVEIEDSIQRFEDKKAEMITKNKDLTLALRDAEEEIERMKKERSRILRDFDEDMARMSFQNEQLRKEVQFRGSRQLQLPERMETGEVSSASPEDSDLARKCRKYNKLIHKLRHKMTLLNTEKERLEKTHAWVRQELEDLKEKHKQFGAVFSQLEESERMKEEKMAKIEEVKQAIGEMTERI